MTFASIQRAQIGKCGCLKHPQYNSPRSNTLQEESFHKNLNFAISHLENSLNFNSTYQQNFSKPLNDSLYE